jgi:hypothetical protein
MNSEIKVYTLKRPVTVGEYTCNEVKLCRPRTKDFVAIGNQPLDTTGAIVSLIASVSGVPVNVVNQFDIEDISMLRIEAMRVFDSYFSTDDYELNPTPPPLTGTEAEGNG